MWLPKTTIQMKLIKASLRSPYDLEISNIPTEFQVSDLGHAYVECYDTLNVCEHSNLS